MSVGTMYNMSAVDDNSCGPDLIEVILVCRLQDGCICFDGEVVLVVAYGVCKDRDGELVPP